MCLGSKSARRYKAVRKFIHSGHDRVRVALNLLARSRRSCRRHRVVACGVRGGSSAGEHPWLASPSSPCSHSRSCRSPSVSLQSVLDRTVWLTLRGSTLTASLLTTSPRRLNRRELGRQDTSATTTPVTSTRMPPIRHTPRRAGWSIPGLPRSAPTPLTCRRPVSWSCSDSGGEVRHRRFLPDRLHPDVKS